ncbi:MAG: hypothetical protein NVSMB56_11890 [Pyrinomonadaceae bacterium]
MNVSNIETENLSDVKRYSRGSAFLEVISVISSALIAEWAVIALIGVNKILLLVPIALALAFMFASHRARGETLRDIGWRTDNFLAAMKLLALPVLLITLVFIVIAVLWRYDDANYAISDKWWRGGLSGALILFARGTIWGLLQEYVLQGFINRRAQEIFGKNWRSVLLVGVIFAALHLPNLPLTLATLIAGIIFGAIYQRTPNLYALGLAHCILTIVLISTVPITALHDLRVGYKFFG